MFRLLLPTIIREPLGSTKVKKKIRLNVICFSRRPLHRVTNFDFFEDLHCIDLTNGCQVFALHCAEEQLNKTAF